MSIASENDATFGRAESRSESRRNSRREAERAEGYKRDLISFRLGGLFSSFPQ